MNKENKCSEYVDIYENSEDNKCRYALGKKGENQLVFFGINPNTADDKKPDKTIKRIIEIAKNNEYDSWLMLNLYPLRAKKTNILPNELNENIKTINENIIKNIFENKKYSVVASWGDSISVKPYLLKCLIDIFGIIHCENIKWFYGGLSKKLKNPYHPLRLNNTVELKPFCIENYIRIILKKQTGT